MTVRAKSMVSCILAHISATPISCTGVRFWTMQTGDLAEVYSDPNQPGHQNVSPAAANDQLLIVHPLNSCHGIISIITSTALNLVDIRITSTTLVHISTRTNRITRRTDLRPLIPLSAKLDEISTKSYCSRRTIRTYR